MIRLSLYKGFLSLDALFSIVPVVLLSLLLIQVTSEISSKAGKQFHDQEVFDKLVSVADHTVKSGAAMKEGDVRYPNWIDAEKLDAAYAGFLREKIGLSGLYVGLEEPDEDYAACIYRLVVVGAEKSISRLFVCGE